ncbi:alginate export family protein [Robertkochia solimangrovi]|uniref:alginate export family protein n=1 Tax=Robertkochia solimangrovi TaxID=2213046 RepID=UPI00117F8DEC|nr:alginate export family protein [Robertkochia solimangrovi]TRZ43561.1 hypothetical protein DMZ48_09060 [Robertkochia solimangrovi]
MKFRTVIWFCILNISIGLAQRSESLTFKLLSQYNEVGFLRDKSQKSPYEKLKYIPLNNQTFITFGGGYRFQAESFINEQFLKAGRQDNLWYLNRILLYTQIVINDRFEVFAELNSSTVLNKNELSPVDKDILAFNQLFFKYHITKNWNLLIGRENLMLGSRRLVDLREGPNVRRSFDLVDLSFITDRITMKAFAGIPVKPKEGVFDNESLNGEELLTGLYLTHSRSTSLNFDFYGLYQKDPKVTYNAETSDEHRYSFGSRFFGNSGKFSYNHEFVYQFGKFGNKTISAYTLSFLGDLKISSKGLIGLKTELISGDKDPKDNLQNTFDAMYPRGAYFGRVARFGPANLIDIHPYINFTLSKFFFELDYDAFWKYSRNDVVYDAALMPAYTENRNSTFIAHQIGSFLSYEYNNHLSFELETNFIIPGKFLIDSELEDTLYHFVFSMEFRF